MNNIIDDIPADETIEMTEALVRAFKIEGCSPACHCCWKDIKVGKTFKLALVVHRPYWNYEEGKQSHEKETTDEMLCDNCTPKMLLKNEAQQLKQSQIGGYTRKHRGRE